MFTYSINDTSIRLHINSEFINIDIDQSRDRM